MKKKISYIFFNALAGIATFFPVSGLAEIDVDNDKKTVVFFTSEIRVFLQETSSGRYLFGKFETASSAVATEKEALQSISTNKTISDDDKERQIERINTRLLTAEITRAEIVREIIDAYLKNNAELSIPPVVTPSSEAKVSEINTTNVTTTQETGDFEKLKLAAEGGDVEAQYRLASVYSLGRHGISKNDVEAVKWLQQAAERGHVDAQDRLGTVYFNGIGGTVRKAEAVKWWEKAAGQGHARAQNNIGHAYFYGIGGLVKNDVQAVRWCRKAAEQGHADAQNFLGSAYFNGGGGLAKSETEAVKWWRKAAEQGHSGAKESLRKLNK